MRYSHSVFVLTNTAGTRRLLPLSTSEGAAHADEHALAELLQMPGDQTLLCRRAQRHQHQVRRRLRMRSNAASLSST